MNKRMKRVRNRIMAVAVTALLAGTTIHLFYAGSPQHPQVAAKNNGLQPPHRTVLTVEHTHKTTDNGWGNPLKFNTITVTHAVVDKSNPLRRLNPLAGVWEPKRLKVFNPFITVSGVVEEIVHEPSDADYHMNLRLDPQYTHLLNTYNRSLMNGNLVVEIIPLDQGHVPIPSVGQHITVTGAYVLDTGHGWMEVHPAWLINGKGSATYTWHQLEQSMQEITASYERLVRAANITVESSNLTVHAGQDAELEIKTAPEAEGDLKVVYSSTQVVQLVDYADEDGTVKFQWHVDSKIKPGVYPVYITLYTHSAKLNLQVV